MNESESVMGTREPNMVSPGDHPLERGEASFSAVSGREAAVLMVRRPLTPKEEAAADAFPVRAPAAWLPRLAGRGKEDPLARQLFPDAAEGKAVPGFTRDPLGEAQAAAGPGLLRKYRGRALLAVTGACALHCRYCFRRHDAGRRAGTQSDWWAALSAIAADATIEEVILSGGDPLMLGDRELAELAARLAAIPALKRLRIHTRMPTAVPERVGEGLLSWLTGTRLTPWVAVHVNHPDELALPGAAAALTRLAEAGIPVLNQGVLLAGVNDDEETLATLFGLLADLRVRPYYLHMLDRVAGAAHFEVSEARAMALMSGLRRRLPGYAVPVLAREVAGAPGKTPLFC